MGDIICQNKIFPLKNKLKEREMFCETHLNNELICYLPPRMLESLAKLSNILVRTQPDVFFNICFLIIFWKTTCGWAYICRCSRRLTCCYTKFKHCHRRITLNFVKCFRADVLKNTRSASRCKIISHVRQA